MCVLVDNDFGLLLVKCVANVRWVLAVKKDAPSLTGQVSEKESLAGARLAGNQTIA